MKGEWLRVNSVLCQTLGYEEKELQQTTFQALTHPDDLSANRDTLKQLIDGEISSMQVAKRYRHAEGHYIWGRLTTSIARLASGEPLCYVSQVEDITDQRQYEANLRQREQEFRSLAENSPDNIIRYDADCKAIYANLRMLETINAKRGFQGKTPLELFCTEMPQSETSGIEHYQDVLKQVISSGERSDIELSLQCRDGSIKTHNIRIVAEKDTQGNIIGALAYGHDVTERKQMEKELYRRERMFRTLAENSPDPIYRYDRNCRRLYVNPIVGKILNKPTDKLIGSTPADGAILVSEQNEKLMLAIRHVFDSGGLPARIDLDYVRLDGRHCKYHSLLEPEFDQDGQVETVLAVAREVTELKLLEEQLQQSNEFIEKIINSVPDPIFVVDRQHRYILLNDASCSFTGYSRDELIGKSCDEVFPKEEADVFLSIDELVFNSGLPNINEEMLTDVHGNKNYIQTKKVSFTTTDGRQFLVGAIRDITDRKAKEQLLEKKQEHLEEAQRIGRLGSWEYDFQTERFTWSKETYRICEVCNKSFNATYESFIGLVHPDDRETVAMSFADSIKNKTTYDLDHRLLLNSGQIKYVSQHGMTYYSEEGIPIRSVGTMRDMTQRKLKEEELFKAKAEAEESNRLKSAFLATMNHELRTPLNHIIGFSQLLNKQPSKAEDFIPIIQDSAESMLEIIEDIFKLAMFEQSEIVVRNSYFELGTFFSNCKLLLSEMLEKSGKHNNINLVLRADPDLISLHINSDQNKINQVICNLFRNAIKFTEKGSLTFELRSDKPNWITFAIHDTGIGVPEDKQNVIFDLFRQADDSHTREHGGVGIGLSISRKIAEILSGTLTFKSEFGVGSTFYFSIPVETYSICTLQSKVIQAPNLKGRTILLVEDDVLCLSVLRFYLLETQATIVEAINGQDAIDKFDAGISLVFTDLHLPILDGYEATRVIKQKYPEVHVVAVTASVSAPYRTKAIQAGCSSLIPKPIKKELLFAEIHRLYL